MRIGISLIMLVPGKIGGMEVYVRNLLDWFLRIDESHEYFLFTTPENDETLRFGENQRVRRIRVLRETCEAEILQAMMKYGVDLYFCPLLVVEPVVHHIPSVVNIPDMQHKYFPEFFSREVLEWRESLYQRSAQCADAVLTLSHYSKETIVEHLQIDPEKVFPVYLAATEQFSLPLNAGKLEEVRRKYELPERYGYYPANTWPHKNHARLFEAMKVYDERYGEPPMILLTGAQDDSNEIDRMLRRTNIRRYVRHLGYVPKEDLPCLYRSAHFLIFPSLFEGFGMPPLEAMICGTPVISSNTTSLPEILGDAALLFDPDDASRIADCIHAISHDEPLRESLIQKGTERAGDFTWERTARETLAVLERAARKERRIAIGEEPLVTVITPSYNQGEFIEETILSVLHQDYPNIEYWVIDGKSTDTTVDILKKYSGRIQWVSEKDTGQSNAINKGLKKAKGEIVCWLNSDDTFLPGAVRKAVEYLQQHRDKVMVYGEGCHMDRSGRIMGRYPTLPFDFQKLAETCFISQPTVLLRREVLETVGYLDEDIHFAMDYDYWIRIATQYREGIGHLQYYLANTRWYPETKTLSKREEVYKDIMSVVQRHYGYVPETWWTGYIYEIILDRVKWNTTGRRSVFNRMMTRFVVLNELRKHFSLYFILKNKFKKWSQAQKKRFYGRYQDGWVSKKYEEDLGHIKGRNLLIHGVHAWPHRFFPLVLSICLNDRPIKKFWKLKKGRFTIQIPLPDWAQGEALHLSIRSYLTFIPASRFSFDGDHRRLAFVLKEVQIL